MARRLSEELEYLDRVSQELKSFDSKTRESAARKLRGLRPIPVSEPSRYPRESELWGCLTKVIKAIRDAEAHYSKQLIDIATELKKRRDGYYDAHDKNVMDDIYEGEYYEDVNKAHAAYCSVIDEAINNAKSVLQRYREGRSLREPGEGSEKG